LTGRALSSIKQPARTVLISEASALAPWSWHAPVWGDIPREPLTYNDAKKRGELRRRSRQLREDLLEHESLSEWRSSRFAFAYDPPGGYDYQWSGD
jgi:hypothetical protein